MDGKKLKTFQLHDLNSRISFSNWLKTNISNERQNSAIEIFKSKRYLEYLKYIEEQVRAQPLKNKMDWIEQIKKLKEERNEEE
jgi:hypothetical protein